MAKDVSVPNPQPVLGLLAAFRRSKVMFAGVKLGVFDALDGKTRTLSQLADELKCQADSLERLLDALAAMGFLTRSAAGYQDTPVASTYLTSSSPRRFTGYIQFSNDVMWRLWEHLEDAVREGTHRWKQVYGWDGPIFSNFFKDEAAAHEFLMGMHGFGMVASPVLVNAIDLSRFRTMVDLGGATGHLVIAACERYPNLLGVVFDLPEAVGLANKVVDASPVAERIDVRAGDFFTDPLPAGDLYALGRIIHDWSAPKIDQLLAKIFAALPSGGALLIAEKVLHDDKTGPMWALMQSLNMLACTEGKERTLPEYDAILSRHGFVHTTLCRTSAPLDIMLTYKP